MAGLGIGPEDFALFRIADPEDRADALESRLQPKLLRVAGELVDGLARVTGAEIHAHPGRVIRRKGVPPGEASVAFAASDRGYRALPHLLLAVSRLQLHARVAARSGADRGGALRGALMREAANLARKGKPFRKLRSYRDWDFEEIPELAPAHSRAFWLELAEDLARNGTGGGIDVGVAWAAEEARSLCVGDLLGTFRDLAPLFKLLYNAA